MLLNFENDWYLCIIRPKLRFFKFLSHAIIYFIFVIDLLLFQNVKLMSTLCCLLLRSTFVCQKNPLSFCYKHIKAKSLCRCRAGRHFYETENEIWAGFVQVGNTEEK